jgi:hypothetical protein
MGRRLYVRNPARLSDCARDREMEIKDRAHDSVSFMNSRTGKLFIQLWGAVYTQPADSIL